MKKILVIEDEPAYLKLLHDQLSSKGYKVVTAQDGKVGLQTALSEKPDLILLDIRMPVMDGMTMLNLLREDPWGKTASVIILTNLGDSIDISNAMNANFARYIVKSDTSFKAVLDDIKTILKE